MSKQPLRPLYSSASMIALKLEQFEHPTNTEILRSLALGQEGCLKARPDGTILDGHHRIFVLRKRGVDVDSLDRAIIEREPV